MRLKGKSVLVTAAAQGMGQAAVLAMAAEGAQVLATDVKGDLLKVFDGVANVRTTVLDVLDRAAIERTIAGMDKLDVLFNCAGYVFNGTILQTEDKDWDFSFNLNARSQFWAIRAALPRMIAAGGGSIINMASVAGSIKGIANRFVYGTTKAAVIGLTKAVAIDHVKQGIRCNAICPGTVDTPSLGDRINAFNDPAAAREQFIARQPMGRLARAEEIAPLVVYLASDEAAFCTGQAYIIDGGIAI